MAWKCPANHENPDDVARFCRDCGAPKPPPPAAITTAQSPTVEEQIATLTTSVNALTAVARSRPSQETLDKIFDKIVKLEEEIKELTQRGQQRPSAPIVSPPAQAEREEPGWVKDFKRTLKKILN